MFALSNEQHMTHLERIRKDIAKLKVNLTARDRTEIAFMTGLSAASVNNYLTGRGTNYDTAWDIREAARRIINKREEALES